MQVLRKNKSGFTLVELLTVLAIITMLLGLLVPSLNMVRRFAKETKQKAQLASIDAALTTFRNDYGDYPPSDSATDPEYTGAQMLCEALLGRDLLGFHPDTQWNLADGVYDSSPQNLQQRKGRYLELATANAFRLGGPGGLYNNTGPLNGDTYVLCDVFGRKTVTLADGTATKAGAPVLYYKANTASKLFDQGDVQERIFNYMDNFNLMAVADLDEDGRRGDHPLAQPPDGGFYNYIRDPHVPTPWPYRPDSYLLITAGADGLYGTADDICNFGN